MYICMYIYVETFTSTFEINLNTYWSNFHTSVLQGLKSSGTKFITSHHQFCIYSRVQNKIIKFWNFFQGLQSQFRKAKLRQPTGQRLSNVRTQQFFFSIGSILFLYYEESLVSSNLNSNLLWFNCAHPNIHL